MLVLHYTVHNPQPRELRYYWADLVFTAVDSQDQNHSFIQAVGREGTTDRVAISLKPAQKLDVWTAIAVPAEGVVPKLIVERERNAPVIRYDLRGKVTPLAAPFADPADSAGATVAKPVAVAAGQVVPIGVFDATLESASYTTEELLGRAPKKGYRYLTATFTLKNATLRSQRLYWGDMLAELRDADGEKVPYTQALLKASRDEKAEGNLEPGEETKVRLYFPLPENVGAKTVVLRECSRVQQQQARPFAFDVSDAK